MLSDDNLKKLAYEVDDIIQSLLEKYQVNPLSLTAVILARIVNVVAKPTSSVRKSPMKNVLIVATILHVKDFTAVLNLVLFI